MSLIREAGLVLRGGTGLRLFGPPHPRSCVDECVTECTRVALLCCIAQPVDLLMMSARLDWDESPA